MKNQLVLKELSTAEVQERLDVERALLQKMKINHAISPIENPNKIKESRKIIFDNFPLACCTQLYFK